MNFDNLRKKAGKGLESLQEKVENLNGGGKKEDERFWKMTLDSTKSGSAVIRFIPSKDDENIVKQVSYFFRGPGGVYSEMSPVSIGKDCPVRDRNGEEWAKAEANGDDALKNEIRKRNQTVKFISNIVVVDDPANPDNNGKVFLFKYGKQIKNIIDKAIKPEYSDEKPIDPFDMWFGANFKFRAKGREMPGRNGDKITVPNYEDSKFADPSELFEGDDAKKEEAFNASYELKEFNDPELFKEYDVLKAKMEKVLGGSGMTQTAADMDEDDVPMENQNEVAGDKEEEKPAQEASQEVKQEDSEEDEDLQFFRSLSK
ncbi:MAG: hypothetical protein ACOCT9_02690 [archaeon]